MSKKTRNIILIILCYILSLFLFEVLIGDGNFERVTQDCEQKGFNTPFPYMTSYIIAGITHFVLVTIIAFICIFIKNMDKEYKRIIYSFPIITFTFSFPMALLAMLFARAFHLYGF